MSKFYALYLITYLLVTIPATAMAKRGWDGKAVITLQDSQPCFSYPHDEEIRKRPYFFDYLAVSKAGPQGGVGGWVIQLASYDKKNPVEPDKPETCIRYGVLPARAEEVIPVKPLEFNTPYRAFLRVSTASGSEQRYADDFCLTRDTKGQTILVGAGWDDDAYEPRCLNPGESPKRGFWQRLFGK